MESVEVKMIQSVEEFVRLRLSDNPEDYRRSSYDHASDDVWLGVIEKHPEMRLWVAHNKTVSLPILRILAQDDNPDVRFAVAIRRKLDQGLFELLAADPESSVRHAIANNAKVPVILLQRLANDADQYVAESAQARLTYD